MIVQTKDLKGRALCWAVDVAMGTAPDLALSRVTLGRANYDTDWNLTGPLMEYHGVEPYRVGGEIRAAIKFTERKNTGNGFAVTTKAFRSYPGHDYLTAVCRCLVGSLLGQEVDVPEALMKD